MNIPDMLEKAKRYSQKHPGGDLVTETNRINRVLGRVVGGIEGVDEQAIVEIMADILVACASRGWHIGISMATLNLPDRKLTLAEVIAEVHLAASLAYAASLTEEPEAPPVFFFALAFRHLLNFTKEAEINDIDILLSLWFGELRLP